MMPITRPLKAVAVFALSVLVLAAPAAPAHGQRALALHPENPHYFLFRGDPTVLIASGEHYGALLNGDFDFIPYFDELKDKRLNLTRTFSGVYREVPGSFNIKDNTLAPRPDQYVAPWARTGGGAAAKYDLTKWNDAYFARLTPQAENGTAPVTAPTPGGGGTTLRRQLKVLHEFMNRLDFVRMRPDESAVKSVPQGTRARALVEPGRQIAIYLSRLVEEKGTDGKGTGKFVDPQSGKQTKLVLTVEPGKYSAEWLDPKTGQSSTQGVAAPGTGRAAELTLTSPAYDQDIALRLVRTAQQ